MKEIIENVNGILQNYNISFSEFYNYPSTRRLIANSDPTKLQQFIQQKFHKKIRINDARMLDLLFLTYNYVSEN